MQDIKYVDVKCKVRFVNRDSVLVEVSLSGVIHSYWIPTSQVREDIRSIKEGDSKLGISEWYLSVIGDISNG